MRTDHVRFANRAKNAIKLEKLEMRLYGIRLNREILEMKSVHGAPVPEAQQTAIAVEMRLLEDELRRVEAEKAVLLSA